MSLTPLADRLKRIARGREILECPSPIHLGAFFSGYTLVIPGLSWLAGALDAGFGGPPQARAWTRAYLAHGDEIGLTLVIEGAIAQLEAAPPLVMVAGNDAPEMWIDAIVDAVRARRPATVLGESTIPWLYAFGLGAQAATEDYFPELGAQRREQLSRFETWLQNYFNAPGVPWQRILRAFEGPGESARYRFASLWDEHLRA